MASGGETSQGGAGSGGASTGGSSGVGAGGASGVGGTTAGVAGSICAGVPPEEPLDILPNVLGDGDVGVDYEAMLEVAGGEPPYAWSIRGGSLPVNLLLSRSSDPRASIAGLASRAGTFPFEVEVRDACGRQGRRGYEIFVRPRPWLAYSTASAYRTLGASDTSSPNDGQRIDGVAGVAEYVWSPRGDALLVKAAPESPTRLFMVDFGGLVPSRAVDVGARLGPTEYVVDTVWAPDGSGFVYSTRESGSLDVKKAYLVRVTGDVPVPGPGELVFEDDGPFSTDPTFSPDATKVINRGRFFSSSIEIVYTDVSGGAPTPVERAHPPLVAGGNVSAWSFSPDSRWFVYEADAEVDDRYELYAVRAENSVFSAPAKLNPSLTSGGDVGTAFPGEELDWTAPKWAPAGTRVAFAADAEVDGTLELYAVDLAGETPSVARKVSAPIPLGCKIRWFDWTDAVHIAYSADVGETLEDRIWLVDAVGDGSPREIFPGGLGSRYFYGVIPDSLQRGFVLLLADLARGESAFWVTRDQAGLPLATLLYETIGPASALRVPAFAPGGAVLLAPGDLEVRGDVGLYRIDFAFTPPSAPSRIGPVGQLTCPENSLTCRKFWRYDGGAAAYLVSGGRLFVTEFDGARPLGDREIRDQDGFQITSFAWPSLSAPP